MTAATITKPSIAPPTDPRLTRPGLSADVLMDRYAAIIESDLNAGLPEGELGWRVTWGNKTGLYNACVVAATEQERDMDGDELEIICKLGRVARIMWHENRINVLVRPHVVIPD